jgi:hypothetical protein
LLLRQADVREAGTSAPARPGVLQENRRIDAEEDDQAENDQETDNADAAATPSASSAAARGEAHAAAGKRKSKAATLATPVLDIVAFSLATPPQRTVLADFRLNSAHCAWGPEPHKAVGPAVAPAQFRNRAVSKSG